MRTIFSALSIIFAASFTIGCGEDRAGEQPLAPTVRLASATAGADSVVMEGEITASPNSAVKFCGFHFGGDTVKMDIKAKADSNWIGNSFNATLRTLHNGHYYAVAYAINGIGMSTSDTMWIQIR